MCVFVAQELASRVQDALFVLMVRDFRGVVQSLRRAYAEGFEWAGKQIDDSAHLWARCYANVDALPPDRTITVSFDRLCAEPEAVVSSLASELGRRLNIDPAHFRPQTFATSHACRVARQTIGTVTGGVFSFQAIAPYDAAAWTDAMEEVCAPIVGTVRSEIQSLLDGGLGAKGSNSHR